MPARKQRVVTFDFDQLCSEYASGMLAGLSLVDAPTDKIKALVFGTGAGLLPMFLQSQLKEKLDHVVTVDISEDMVNVARNFFGFQEDEQIKSVIGDAYDYPSKAVSNNEIYDMVFVDINFSDDDLALNPPIRFLDTEYLQRLVELISDNGFVAINLLLWTASKETRDKVYSYINAVQCGSKLMVDLEEEKNQVLILTKKPARDDGERVKAMEEFLKNNELDKGTWMTKNIISKLIPKIRNVEQS